MDPFSIAALVATVAGAAVQHKAATDAQKRQQDSINQGLMRQRDLQRQAEKTALDAAQQYETPKRQEQQQQLAEEITQNLIAPVSESQAVRAAQQTTQGEVSGDYNRSKAAADLETVKQAEALARLLGKSSSAGRLRMGEGINMMDTQLAMNQLNRTSQGEQQVANINTQLAGQVDPGSNFLGSLLQAGGTAYLGANGFGGGKVTKGNEMLANMSSDPIGSLNSQMGWTGDGGSGVWSWFGKK